MLEARGAMRREASMASRPVRHMSGGIYTPLANGGIVTPREGQLEIGTMLVRYGNGRGDPAQAMGRWWMLERHFYRVSDEARGYDVSIPWMYREVTAVLLDWGTMTQQLVCRVRQPLLCYRGYGGEAFDPKDPRAVMGIAFDGRMAEDLGIAQLFIPGLDKPEIYKRALEVVSHKDVAANHSKSPNRPAGQGRRGALV